VVAKTPLEVDQLFAKALAAADLEAIVALYEPKAVVPGQPGQPSAVGLDQIREAMRPFVALKPTNVVLAATVVAELDGLAILYDDWRATGHASDGSEVPLSGKAIEVMRRTADGSWKFIFDDANARG
jgi:uncharacterized protein (TIGR02246 family)